MKRLRLIIILGLIGVALVAALLSQRGRIANYVRMADQPELPESVRFEELPPVEPGQEPPAEEPAEEPGEPSADPEATEPQELPGSDGGELAEPEEEPMEEPVQQTPGIPTSFNLAVPVTSQAPHGNWDLPYQEACEEASIYMVAQFYGGKPEGKIDPAVADADLKKIFDFEDAFLGTHLDTTAAQTAVLAEQLYGLERVEVLSDPTVEDIKRHVAAGRPVIVPAAGRSLGNPFFTAPGPVYHMLVIRGYTDKGFITNDPGTRHGEAYFYRYDQVMRSIGDWNDGDPANGEKVILVLYPNAE